MANQMIALGVRGPQIPDVSRVGQQFAQMANMMMQQRAAERQAAQAQQAMQFAAAEEGRKKELHSTTLTKAQQENILSALEIFREGVADVLEGDTAAAEAVRADLIARVPGWNKVIAPASQWTPGYMQKLMIDAQKEIDKTIATPVASMQLTPENQAVSVTVGGTRPGGELLNIGRGSVTSGAAPTAAPMGAPATAPQMSQATPETLSEVVTIALETGVMSKTNYDKLLSIAPPESRAKIAGWVQSNNIEVVDEAAGGNAGMRMEPMSYDGQTPQSEFAVNRRGPMQSQVADLRNAPPMQQTLAQSGGRPLIIKTPTPPGANVPIERVRAEGAAGRETPAEAAAKARAVAQANAAIETEKKAAEKLPGRRQVSTIIGKIRNAYEQLEKRQAIASEKRGGFANVVDYLATSTPGREVQKALGTSSSKYLSEIVNSRKLLATAIKNATGMSAQEMNSNIELQLTLDALTDPTQGIEAARSTLDTLEELYGAPRTAPPQVPRKTPTRSSIPKDVADKYGL